MTAKSSPN